jgi:glucose/arabinose dehydrogenase
VFANRAVGPIPSIQSVPTTVVEGPDGSLFVGELTGAPFPIGAARVYRVPKTGGTPVVVASGFTNIIDIAIGPNGAGYVLEHDADGIIPPIGPGVDGRLIRINGDGTQTVIASAGLVKPGGVAVGPDGALYVTIRSISAGAGQVIRIVS